MEEVSFFYDKEGQTKITQELEFDPVMAGETTRKVIFAKSNIKYPIIMNLDVEGDNIELETDSFNLKPFGIEKVLLILTPSLTSMVPITGRINAKIRYVVR